MREVDSPQAKTEGVNSPRLFAEQKASPLVRGGRGLNFILLKILHSRLEQLHIVLAGDVAVKAALPALAMTHLAQHAAVGGDDALDGTHRAVGVECGVHSGIAVQIHILGSDLAVCHQLLDQLLRCEEAALAVGNGHIVNLPDLGTCQPRRFVGANPCAHDLGLVAGNVIVGQGGAGVIGVDDLAVGHKTQLDQCLEAVADAQHQTVPAFQQAGDLLLDLRIAEEGGDAIIPIAGDVTLPLFTTQEIPGSFV